MSIIFLLLFACCGVQKQNLTVADPISSVQADTSRYVVIKYDSTKRWDMEKGRKPASLSKQEIKQVDELLKKAVLEHNMVVKGEQLHIDDLDKYRRQFVPYTNAKGEKEVWVNCFCSNRPNWRKQLVMVDDGGKCYFNVTINLSLKTSGMVYVNGVG